MLRSRWCWEERTFPGQIKKKSVCILDIVWYVLVCVCVCRAADGCNIWGVWTGCLRCLSDCQTCQDEWGLCLCEAPVLASAVLFAALIHLHLLCTSEQEEESGEGCREQELERDEEESILLWVFFSWGYSKAGFMFQIEYASCSLVLLLLLPLFYIETVNRLRPCCKYLQENKVVGQTGQGISICESCTLYITKKKVGPVQSLH